MKLDIPRIRALCFDVDGTLRDTDDMFVHSLARLLHPARAFFPENNPGPAARRFVMMAENLGNLLFGIPDRLNIDHHLARLGDSLHRFRATNH